MPYSVLYKSTVVDLPKIWKIGQTATVYLSNIPSYLPSLLTDYVLTRQSKTSWMNGGSTTILIDQGTCICKPKYLITNIDMTTTTPEQF